MTAPLLHARARARLLGRPSNTRRPLGRGDRPADPSSDADLIDVLARSLRSGCSVEQALRDALVEECAPAVATLRRVVDAIDRGRPLHSALRDQRADADPSSARLLRLLAVGLTSGGRLADVLDDAAAAVRQRQGARSDAVAQAAQARASAAVIALLPVGFVVLSVVAAPAVPEVLFGTTIGWLCLGLGGVLDATGWWWMNRLIGSVGR